MLFVKPQLGPIKVETDGSQTDFVEVTEYKLRDSLIRVTLVVNYSVKTGKDRGRGSNITQRVYTVIRLVPTVNSHRRYTGQVYRIHIGREFTTTITTTTTTAVVPEGLTRCNR